MKLLAATEDRRVCDGTGGDGGPPYLPALDNFTYEIYTTSVEIERTFNNGSQLLTHTEGGTATTFTYDANGNRLTQSVGGAVTNYTWDTENRLRRIQASGLDQTGSGGSGDITLISP